MATIKEKQTHTEFMSFKVFSEQNKKTMKEAGRKDFVATGNEPVAQNDSN